MDRGPARAVLRATGWGLGLILAGAAAARVPQNDDDRVRYLDARSPAFSQPIEGEKPGPAQSRFVEVRVVEVVNPDKVPLTFEVWYKASAEAKVFLGGFSLYPADNPGRFIVATQGKVKDEGAIVLSLIIPDTAPNRGRIRVAVKRLTLLKG
jgi:hypothetical protein